MARINLTLTHTFDLDDQGRKVAHRITIPSRRPNASPIVLVSFDSKDWKAYWKGMWAPIGVVRLQLGFKKETDMQGLFACVRDMLKGVGELDRMEIEA